MKVPWLQMLVILQFCTSERIAALAADFSDANLSSAKLTNADLRGSNFAGADLTAANLSGTNLTDTNITQSQLDGACGSGTKLPAGLRIQPCRSVSDTVENDRPTNADHALNGAGSETRDLQQFPDIERVLNSRVDVSTRVGQQ